MFGGRRNPFSYLNGILAWDLMLCITNWAGRAEIGDYGAIGRADKNIILDHTVRIKVSRVMLRSSTHRLQIPMTNRWLKFVEVVKSAEHVFDLKMKSGWPPIICTRYGPSRTREIRSGISQYPDLRKSRTFPFGSQERTIQALSRLKSSTNPTSRTICS